MEYNTQREQLKITDYGRNVSKMIAYAKTLEDRDERTRLARLIVEVMGQVNPKVRERADYRHILWDHLMLMADYDLDVDVPYEVKRAEEVEMKPHRLEYSDGKIEFRHYGRALEDMVKAAAEMPEGEERRVLTEQLAHTMKRLYLQWNRDSVDDDVIVEQLDQLSGGRLKLPEGFRFKDAKFYLEAAAGAKKENGNGAKKKKKKKNK